MSDEPSLSEVRADIVGRLEQDKRLRAVEVGLAAQVEAVKNLEAYLPRMEDRLVQGQRQSEDRLVAAIEAARPKVWQAVGALASVTAVFLVIAAAVYAR